VSNHPHTVPEGWTKGEPLTRRERNGQWSIEQTALPPFGTMRLADVAYITFDSAEACDAFLEWWGAPKPKVSDLARDLRRIGGWKS
jgi:hypothetical protein